MKANPDISQALIAAKNADKIKELAKDQGLWLACEQKGPEHYEVWSSISSFRGQGKTEREASEAHFDRLSMITDRIAQLFALWESGLKPEKRTDEK